MRYIEPYLNKLIDMRSTVFMRFFDQSCKRFLFRLQGEMSQDQGFISVPSQYINQSTISNTFEEDIDANTSSFAKQFCGCFTKCKRRQGP